MRGPTSTSPRSLIRSRSSETKTVSRTIALNCSNASFISVQLVSAPAHSAAQIWLDTSSRLAAILSKEPVKRTGYKLHFRVGHIGMTADIKTGQIGRAHV